MKNNKKKSPMMKIVSAAAMLAVSASMLGTSTYAWFTMNTTVTVTGLQVTAEAEDGIVIAPYATAASTATLADSAYAASATAGVASATLLPTFTGDATTWYHNWSTELDNGQAYGTEGYEIVDNVENGDQYYLANKFSIKSPNGSKDIYVSSIDLTSGTGTQDYDASIRVLIKSGSTVQIYNKNGGTWTSETAAHTNEMATDVTATAASAPNSTKILTATSAGVDVYVYVYYDGEDPACKSSNIPNAFAASTLGVTFTSEQPTGD